MPFSLPVLQSTKRVVLPSAYEVPISSHQGDGLYRIEASRHPIEPLAKVSTAAAHLLVDSEVDGIARRVNLALIHEDGQTKVPALSLAMLEAGGDFKARWGDGTSLELQGANNLATTIPIDARGRAIINYRYVPGQVGSVVPDRVDLLSASLRYRCAF